MPRARYSIVAATSALCVVACGARTGDLDAAFRASSTVDSGAPIDGGPNDASPACGLARSRVFLTSTLHDANLGGVAGADAECASLARSQGLAHHWRAWLSDRTTSARDHIHAVSGDFVMLDGTAIASSLDALVSGSIAHPIDLTESGFPIADGNTEVWTGTFADGGGSSSGAGYCDDGNGNDWASNDVGARFSFVGHSNATDTTWTAVYLQYCNRTNVRLYCFESCD